MPWNDIPDSTSMEYQELPGWIARTSIKWSAGL